MEEQPEPAHDFDRALTTETKGIDKCVNTWYKFLSPLDPQRILKHGLPEIVVAAILTVAIVAAWKRVETGRGQAKM